MLRDFFCIEFIFSCSPLGRDSLDGADIDWQRFINNKIKIINTPLQMGYYYYFLIFAAFCFNLMSRIFLIVFWF